MRRGLALAAVLLVLLGGLAFAQGGRGIFIAPDCTQIANPEVGFTWCLSATAPFSLQYWTGSAWSTPSAATGPYVPSTFTLNGVLYGNDTGAILVTSQGAANSVLTANAGAPVFSSTPIIGGFTTTNQAAGTIGPYGAASGNTGEMRLLELAANGTEYVGFKAPDAITTSYVNKWPSAPGTNGQCLVVDGGAPVQTFSYGACSGGGSGITSLGGLAASVQAFANDTNVTISSLTSTHTIGWTGVLSVARGGIGVNGYNNNGVAYWNGLNVSPLSTGTGAADTVLRSNAGVPQFGAVDVSKAAAITGLMRTANLGSGTANSSTFLRGDQTYATPPAVSSASNYGFNTSFEIWGAGTVVAPTGWTLTAGASTRNTTAGQFKIGTASLALTRSGTDANLNQNVAATWGPIGWWQSQSVVLGGWVRCTVAARGVLALNDGVNTQTSSAHSGGSAFEFLTVPMTVSASATSVTMRAKVITGNTTCQFDGLVLSRATTVVEWVPELWRGRKGIMSLGAGPSGTNPSYFSIASVSTVEANISMPVPYKGVGRNFTCKIAAASAATNTVRKNAVDTAITGAYSSQVITDFTNEAEFAKSDLVTVKTTEASGNVQGCWMEYEEIP